MNKIATLITALAMTACTQSELVHNDQHNRPLTFGTYVGNATETRAGDTYVASTTLPDKQAFGLFCYMHSSDWTTVAASTNANFMYNQMVRVRGISSPQTFTYTPVKYWPNNSRDKLSFLAYYPHGGAGIAFEGAANATYTPSTLGMPKVHFTVQPTAAKQVDFMYADPVTNQTKANSKVDFAFRHALTKITLKAKRKADPDGETVVEPMIILKAVKLIGMKNINTFTFGTGAGTGWSGTPTGNATYTIANLTSTALTTTDTDVAPSADNTLLLLPQEIDGKQQKLSITYTQDGDEATVETPITPVTWTANQRYTYTITINPGNLITFTSTVGEWDPDFEVELPVMMTTAEFIEEVGKGNYPPVVTITDVPADWADFRLSVRGYPAGSLDLTMSVQTTVGIPVWGIYNCNALKTFSAPNMKGSIGKYAFNSCAALKSVYLPEMTGGIEASAFDGCKALTSITLGAAGTAAGSSIHIDAFNGFDNIGSCDLTFTAKPTGTITNNEWQVDSKTYTFKSITVVEP